MGDRKEQHNLSPLQRSLPSEPLQNTSNCVPVNFVPARHRRYRDNTLRCSNLFNRFPRQSCSASIVRLLGIRCPSAIALAVVSAVPLAIKCPALTRVRSHIGSERFKAIPAGANRYAAPAVQRPTDATRIRTSIAHSGPCDMQSRLQEGSCMSMSCVGH